MCCKVIKEVGIVRISWEVSLVGLPDKLIGEFGSLNVCGTIWCDFSEVAKSRAEHKLRCFDILQVDSVLFTI